MNTLQARIALTEALREAAYRLASKTGFNREYPISDEWDLQVGWKIFFEIKAERRAEVVKTLNDKGYNDVAIEEMLVQFVRLHVLRIDAECEQARVFNLAKAHH